MRHIMMQWATPKVWALLLNRSLMHLQVQFVQIGFAINLMLILQNCSFLETFD